jgi:hypothetical protein
MICSGIPPRSSSLAKLFAHRHLFSLFSSLSDIDTRQFNLSAAEKQEFIEEVNTELSVYLGMLYFLIEVFKGDDDFGDELSETADYLSPSLR